MKEVWFVDPATRQLTVYRPGRTPRVFRDHEILETDDLLPGFRYPLARLFETDLWAPISGIVREQDAAEFF